MAKIGFRLRPSGAERWSVCTAQPAACQDIDQGEDQGSRYAAEGTVAHSVLEDTMRDYPRGTPYDWVGDVRESDGYTFTVTESMAAHVEACIEYADQQTGGLDRAVLLMPEREFEIDLGVLKEKGTADLTALTRRAAGGYTLHTFDLKYGAGVRKVATGNGQLLMYGLGAVQLLGGPGYRADIREVVLHIMQPRIAGGFTKWVLTRGEMQDHVQALGLAAGEAMDPERRQFRPGEHCKWCPLDGRCRAQAEKVASMVAPGFDLQLQQVGSQRFIGNSYPVSTLNGNQLGVLLHDAEFVINTVNAWRARAHDILERGGYVPGWCLERKPGRSRWRDPDEAATTLMALGLDRDCVYVQQEPKVIGITEARNAVKAETKGKENKAERERLLATVQSLIETPEGELGLTPLAEARAPVSTADQRAEQLGVGEIRK